MDDPWAILARIFEGFGDCQLQDDQDGFRKCWINRYCFTFFLEIIFGKILPWKFYGTPEEILDEKLLPKKTTSGEIPQEIPGKLLWALFQVVTLDQIYGHIPEKNTCK